jgi:hypothetical protein
MFRDEFYYNPKLSLFFKSPCMKFEGEGGGDGDGDGGGGGGGGDNNVAVLDGDGNFTEDFYNSLPEDDQEMIRRYKNPRGIAKGHMELRRTFDKPADRVLVMPDENSDDAEWAAYRQKIGVPQDATGYEFELNPELENIEANDDRMNKFRAIAKKYDIPKDKFSGIVNEYLALINEEAGNFELIRQNNEVKALEKDNEIADEYFGQSKDERIARADMLLRKYGNIEMKNEKGEVVANAIDKLLEKYPSMKHSPWLAMIVDKIAEDMSPQRLKGIGGVSTPTNAALKVKIAELRKNEAYTDASHPDHQRINQEVTDLYKKMSA